MEQAQAAVGRPRGFDAEMALRTAQAVFWRKGYLATSVDDLTREMNIRRSSFYAAYGSKHDTLLATLRMYCEDANAAIAAVAAAAPDADAALTGVLRVIADPDGGRKGCFMLNCLSEVAAGDPAVDRIAQAQLAALRAHLASALRGAGRMFDRDAVDRVLAYALGLIGLRKFGCKAGEIERNIARSVVTIP